MHSVPAACFAAALALATGALTAHAGTIYSYSLGASASVSYRVFCQNGQIISGESSAAALDVACADSSNIFLWRSGVGADGAAWCNVQTDDRKSAAFRKTLRDSLQKLFDQGKLIVNNKLSVEGNVQKVQKSVLTVPQSVLAGPPRSLEQLLIAGVIRPADILYRRDYAGGPLEVNDVDIVEVGPGQSFSTLTYYGYVETSAIPVPAGQPRSLVLLPTALGLAGTIALWRWRRRGRELEMPSGGW